MPKISIIIPCYNVENDVERTLKSAMNQTLKDIEIIVVNDGSTDKTKQVIETIIEGDDRIKLINKPNGGLSSARNIGIENATGEYIQHVDAGDWLHLEACEKTYKKAIEKDLDIVFYDLYAVFKDSSYKKWTNFRWKEEKIYTSQEALDCYLRKDNNCYCIWNKIIRKELYNGIEHPVHIALGEDLATMPRLIAKAKRLGKINEAYIYWVCSEGSMSHKDLEKKFIHLFWTFDVIEEFFKEQNIYEMYKEKLRVLKLDQLTRFIYCKPIADCPEYDLAATEFLNLVKTEDLTSLPIKRRVYCYLQKWCPNESVLVTNIKILQCVIKLLHINITIN